MKEKLAATFLGSALLLGVIGWVWWGSETESAAAEWRVDVFSGTAADEPEPQRTGQYVLFAVAGFCVLASVIMYAGSSERQPRTPTMSEAIADLKRLHIAGDLTEAQFDEAKARVVDRHSGGT